MNMKINIILTTNPKTSVRTRSPISGDISEPNCCSVVRKRLSLLSWRAPHAGGSCWPEPELAMDGGDGVRPLTLLCGECAPFIPKKKTKKDPMLQDRKNTIWPELSIHGLFFDKYYVLFTMISSYIFVWN